MKQHPVPQQISSYQFRLVGDMTLKQFSQLAIGVAVAGLIYSTELHFAIKGPLMVFAVAAGAAFAFLPIRERPLSIWIFAFFRSIYSPTEYYWRPSSKPYEFFAKDTTQDTTQIVEAANKVDSTKTPAPLNKLEQSEKLFLKKINLLLRGQEEEYKALTNQGSQTTQSAEELLAKLSGNASTTTTQTPVDQINDSLSPVQKQSEENINNLINPQRHSFAQTVTEPTATMTSNSNQPSVLQPSTPVQPVSTPAQFPMQNTPVQTTPVSPQTVSTTNPVAPQTTSTTPAAPQPTTVLYSNSQTSTNTSPPPASQSSTTNPVQQALNQFSQSAPPPSPPERAGTLTGQVMDASGKPVDGAILEITDESGAPVRAVKTNRYGHFSVVTPLLNGVYNLITDKDGLKFNAVRFEVIGEIVPPFAIKSVN